MGFAPEPLHLDAERGGILFAHLGTGYQPAKIDGAPENCHPEDEEVEINLPDDYREQVRAAYAREAEVAIGMIEAQVQQLLADNAPAQWVKDDAPEPDYEYWGDYEEAA